MTFVLLADTRLGQSEYSRVAASRATSFEDTAVGVTRVPFLSIVPRSRIAGKYHEANDRHRPARAQRASDAVARRASLSGSADQVGRRLARRLASGCHGAAPVDKMADVLGQPVVVENRPGAGGTIGAKIGRWPRSRTATPLMGSTSKLLIAPAAYKNAGYMPGHSRRFSCCRHQRSPCRASVGRRELRRRIDQPGEVQAGRAEFRLGRQRHAAAYRRRAAEGAGEDRDQSRSLSRRRQRSDRPGGRTGPDYVLRPDPDAPYIQEGRLQGLAIASATRSKLAPDIPTMVESGFPQFVTTSINTVVAPPNTPIEIRRQLSKAVAARAGLGAMSRRHWRHWAARRGRHRRRNSLLIWRRPRSTGPTSSPPRISRSSDRRARAINPARTPCCSPA